ncbi:hypothetical protein [Campylobacter gracilis]|uniref:Uncharacterized protein n=1 Tax=Campylobacter gracilis RM3268 TaxID=553220 RepID=C8PI30_9BACT|nr:hypothetical protein [Campylobacter gracilis]AKT91621.1 hypothetical protein CGRAC_0150 [Campylobacter gracilis]EEV17420.1 hypothetical protein CAMGR0001_0011 [Campylobacter gracilis RM3268]UEB46171.1 hypothetical protein LK410_03480 [Campylobacter gracilis]SUW77932.1 Uncharacterised protein [Campylobacter gracilis]
MSGKISTYGARGDQRKVRMKRQIFSELGGFVLYEPALLARYLDEHGLANGDVLAYFTQTEHGGAVTEEGIAVPILGVRSDYYDFAVTVGEADEEIFNQNEAKIISRGWIFHSSGTLKIAGIGYFKDMSRISEQNSLSFRLERGRYRLEILGGYQSANFSGSSASRDDTPILSDTPVFHLRLTPSAEPKFSGDLETSFYF